MKGVSAQSLIGNYYSPNFEIGKSYLPTQGATGVTLALPALNKRIALGPDRRQEGIDQSEMVLQAISALQLDAVEASEVRKVADLSPKEFKVSASKGGMG